MSEYSHTEDPETPGTLTRIAHAFDQFSERERLYFLALVAHRLTICTRDYYTDTPQVVSSAAGSGVGNLNEIQHRVAGILSDVLTKGLTCITGQELVEWLMEWARNGQLEESLIWALSHALAVVGSPPSR